MESDRHPLAEEAGGDAHDLLTFGGQADAYDARKSAGIVEIRGDGGVWSDGRLTPDAAASRPKHLRVFVNYRRDDSEGYARWLYDRLSAEFGAGGVFVDAGRIAPAQAISRIIEENVRACDVMITLIGPRWLSVNADGRRRLDEENDWVRLEIAAALGRMIPVVPVLVDGAKMPKAPQLPPELRDLADLNAVALGSSWNQDAAGLAAIVRQAADSVSPTDRFRWIHVPKGTSSPGPEVAAVLELARAHGVTEDRLRPMMMERPQATMVAPFKMASTCVTNESYYAFTRETGHGSPSHWGFRRSNSAQRPFPPNEADHPVVNVTALDAEAYCRWSRTRLPRRHQWEWAASGPDRRPYPWGATYDAGKCNSMTNALVPVSAYEDGDSYNGVRQMCGNVAEWVVGTNGRFQTRGGSYETPCAFWGLAFVFRESDGKSARDVGFRVVR